MGSGPWRGAHARPWLPSRREHGWWRAALHPSCPARPRQAACGPRAPGKPAIRPHPRPLGPDGGFQVTAPSDPWAVAGNCGRWKGCVDPYK